MSQPFLGMIALFPYNFAPRGWAFCNGQIMSIAQNTALFSLLGTTFGGNGQTTFALPDLRGRVPVGVGQGPGLSAVTLGEVAGAPTVTLNITNMPAHTHAIDISSVAIAANVRDEAGNTRTPVGHVLAKEAAGVTAPYSDKGPTQNAKMDSSAFGIAGLPTATGPGGSGQPVDIHNPYLGMNYCIALEGIFPSRN